MGKISLYLNQLKAQAGYTQQQLSDLTGIPLGSIPRYFATMEDDAANFETVRKLVVAMHGSLDELAGISKPPSAHPDGSDCADPEVKVTLRWEGDAAPDNYQAVVASLQARLAEKDERLTHRSDLIEEAHRHAQEEIMRERSRANAAILVSYATLGLFALLFVLDYFLPSVGWIQR